MSPPHVNETVPLYHTREILGVSADVVAVRLFRAKQKLAEKMNKKGGVSVG